MGKDTMTIALNSWWYPQLTACRKLFLCESRHQHGDAKYRFFDFLPLTCMYKGV